jgi:hypothetical protein
MKQPRKPEGLLIPPSEVTLIAIAAFRYYLGQQTIAVQGFCRWLQAAWRELDGGTKAIIERELEKEFSRDDEARGLPPKAEYRHLRLGHDCDRAAWSRVRALYRTPKCCLCGKQMGKGMVGSIHLDGEYSCVECAPHECEVCGKPFAVAEQIIPNNETRRPRHPGCAPLGRDAVPASTEAKC